MIRKITEQDNFTLLARLLNEAFLSIATEFGLTKENAPTNNAFITLEELKNQFTAEREFYMYEEKEKSIGFIALEKSRSAPGTFYIEKLAVHLDHRHGSIGRTLMDFATERIIQLGGKRISIGLIDTNTVLKNWYQQQGYIPFKTKIFDHLPFKVCLMEKIV